MTEQLPLPHARPEPDRADETGDERDAYRERLRQHLQEPAFRAIEGFPLGEDEDILALSDPPYYTACPNPFLPEILARWQAKRVELREELGLPDDADDNGDNGQVVYHREPFATDVSEGKNDPIYNAHSYHTKVPHKAIMRYILHYTDPGDIVFDGFCGTGMTGVAAQLCNDKQAVESLGYRVKKDNTILDEQGQLISRLGARQAVLVDLSPAATFIAYNYNMPVDVAAFKREAKCILHEGEKECGWMYETTHTDGKTKGRINYTVWSDVFVCPECGSEMVFWNVAVDQEAGQVRNTFPCPGCGAEQSKRTLERAWDTAFDHALGWTVRRSTQVPVLINYSVGKKRYEKTPEPDDLALIRKTEESDISYWFPTDPMMFKGEQWGDTWRAGVHAGITHVHHFYTRRNLATFSALKHRATDRHIQGALLGGYTVGLRTARFLPLRWVQKDTGPMKPHTAGTLYVPSLNGEQNWLNIARSRIAAVSRQVARMKYHDSRSTCISAGSASAVPMNDNSVDYVFIDPPFGANLMYSELNFIWEAWLRVLTNNQSEAIVNRTQRKDLSDYQYLMERCFREFYRTLKPGRWMTIEFHNSQNTVWNAIQEAILRAGFMVADVRTLDKKQGTFKQVTTSSAVKQDLIISAYKPRSGFERRFLEQAGSIEGAWAFIRQHLAQLPIVVKQDGALEVIAERQAYLLYDRMVAFHIQRGFSVPLGAAEFYAGLKQRFPERDEMYFLPDQVAEYDRERLRATRVEQLALFVTDEKSTIQWLRRELDPDAGAGLQTYQDIQPKFLRELHQARHEALPELSEVLEQNFLQDEQERWYVPDPNRASDLEKLRQRALLREFARYVEGRGRLRQFRTEAVRAGFADAWHRRDYATIVSVAEQLPERVLQEDADLLMYYDNASLRA